MPTTWITLRFSSFVRWLMCAGALWLTASCGGGNSGKSGYGPTGPTGGTGGTGSTSNAISVNDNSFSPSATTVPIGTTVTWTWNGRNPHDVTFNDGPKSDTQTSGTYSRTFSAAGTYNYHCTVHGTAMSGSVTVK